MKADAKIPRVVFERMKAEFPARLLAAIDERLTARIPEFAELAHRDYAAFERQWQAAVTEFEVELWREVRAEFARWAVEGSA